MDIANNRIDPARLFILFGIILFFAYSNSFKASWQFDDKPNILKNPRIQIQEISFNALAKAATAKPGSGDLYRPAACISLGLNWFFGQENVLGYHLVNFLIHWGSAFILFLVVRLIFATPRLRERYSPCQIEFMAIIATLFWALNPVHVQAVTYIVQRMASMAGFFSILAIYFYLKNRLATHDRRNRSLFAIFAIISYAMALMSKENTVTIILCIPVFEFLFFEYTLSWPLIRKSILVLIIGSIAALFAAMILRPEVFDFVLNYYINRPFTLTERVLTEQRILLFYLSQLFFPSPWRLSIEHDFALSTSLFSPWTTWAAILTNLAFVCGAVRVAKKYPLLSLSVLFFYCNHIVESTILPLELVFEHRNYLPSMFIFLPLALLINYGLEQVNTKFLVAIVMGFTAFIFTIEGIATYERNKTWRTEETLWLDALVKAPESARPMATLAIKLAWGPNPTESKYRKALELTEKTLSMRMARNLLDAAQLGNMASIQNKLGNYSASTLYYERALAIAPQNANIRYNYCKNLIATGNFLRARDELGKILEAGYMHSDYFQMLGFVYLWMAQPEKALTVLQKALQLNHSQPDVLLCLGKCLSLLGYHKRAGWFFSLARKEGRDNAVTALCIMENAIMAKDDEAAIKVLKRSLQRFTLPFLFQPLVRPKDQKYREIRLEENLLIPYLKMRLLKTIDEYMYSVDVETE